MLLQISTRMCGRLPNWSSVSTLKDLPTTEKAPRLEQKTLAREKQSRRSTTSSEDFSGGSVSSNVWDAILIFQPERNGERWLIDMKKTSSHIYVCVNNGNTTSKSQVGEKQGRSFPLFLDLDWPSQMKVNEALNEWNNPSRSQRDVFVPCIYTIDSCTNKHNVDGHLPVIIYIYAHAS